MSSICTIRVGDKLSLDAELNDSAGARALLDLLPLEFTMERWGDEYYGDCGLDVARAKDAREEMAVGELAAWPAGNALCIFFGPTPASRGDEPRAYEPVNPVGRVLGDVSALKKLGARIKVRVEKG